MKALSPFSHLATTTILLIALLCVSACGFRGPLYLPEEEQAGQNAPERTEQDADEAGEVANDDGGDDPDDDTDDDEDDDEDDARNDR